MRSNFCPCRLQSERGVKGRIKAPSEDRVSGNDLSAESCYLAPSTGMPPQRATLDDLRTSHQADICRNPPPSTTCPICPLFHPHSSRNVPQPESWRDSEPKMLIGGSHLQTFFLHFLQTSLPLWDSVSGLKNKSGVKKQRFQSSNINKEEI